jgi:hypothetical protein
VPTAVVVALLAPPAAFALNSLSLGLSAWATPYIAAVLGCDALLALAVAVWIGCPFRLLRLRAVWGDGAAAGDPGFRRRVSEYRRRRGRSAVSLILVTLAALIGLNLRPDHQDALLGAVKHLDVDAARSELDRGAHANRTGDPYDTEGGSRTPLNIAVRWHDVYMVRMLLSRGADPRAYDIADEGDAFDVALQSGDGTVAGLLLTGGNGPVRPEILNAEMTSAAFRDRSDVVWFLLQHGADPNAPLNAESPWGRSLLVPSAGVREHPAPSLLTALGTAGMGDTESARLLRAAAGRE